VRQHARRDALAAGAARATRAQAYLERLQRRHSLLCTQRIGSIHHTLRARGSSVKKASAGRGVRTITTGIEACSLSGVGAAVDAGDGEALA
jgi:hypothetical protein